MKKQEAIDKLKSFGIYQLNHGESLQDALDYVDGKLSGSRKGYRVKSDDGRPLSKHEIIKCSYKDALSKHVSEPDWVGFDEEDPDLQPKEDQREDRTQPGYICGCHYCGVPLLIDEGPEPDILNCEDCMSYAILKNCM